MSFWDGTGWVSQSDASPARPVKQRTRARDWLATAVMIIGLVAMMIPLSSMAARNRYTGTLTATPDVLHSGDYFDVRGCGYDTDLGNVVIGFTGGSWGSPLDDDGCFRISNIPALSGDTLPPGVYEVTAYQKVHRRWKETGETTVTVVK